MVGRGTKGFGRGGVRVLGVRWVGGRGSKNLHNWAKQTGGFGRCCGSLFTVLRAMWIETAQQQGGNVGLNCSVLTAPVCQRCTVLAQGGLCRTLTSWVWLHLRPHPHAHVQTHPQNEHLFAASFNASAATCRLTAGRLSAWFHCVTLLHRPLRVESLEKRHYCNRVTIITRVPGRRLGLNQTGTSCL